MSERYEFLDRRVLGAVRMVDVVTQQPIPRALHVFSDELRFVRNRMGFDVISHAEGFEDYATAFDLNDPPVAAPAPRAFTAWVEDIEREYMVRAFTVTLPRDPAPPARDPADPSRRTPPGKNSLFIPVNVELLPAQSASIGGSWAVLRIRVLREDDGAVFPGVLVRAMNAGTDAGWGVSDAGGEAVVAVAGLPRFRTSSNAAQPLTDRTTLDLSFIPLGDPPDTPRDSLSGEEDPLPGFFFDWRTKFDEAAQLAQPALPGRPVIEDGIVGAAGMWLPTDATPGREFRLTVRVTP